MEQIFQNVIINRQEINSIEFEKESVEIPLYPGGEQTFEILISNYGSPTHIHLSVSDELKGQITFLRDNPYVLQKEYISAVARIPQEGRVLTKGQIFITVGYGSKKLGFPVQLGKIEPKPQEIPADESDAEEEGLKSLSPQSMNKAFRPRPRSGSSLGGLTSSVFRNFTGGFSSSPGKRTQRSVRENEKLPLTIAFGGFLLLVGLFFLYFVLPKSLFQVSFIQTLVFSILFVACLSYILLKIGEEA